MDSFDDFLGDDRKTVSEGFSAKKLKFPPTGIHGSRSDNGDRRNIRHSDNGKRKGAISSRTSKMAQRAFNPGEETPESFASTAHLSVTSSNRSSFSSSHDANFDGSSRSQQIAELMEASNRLNIQHSMYQQQLQNQQRRSNAGSPADVYPPRNPRSRSNSPATLVPTQSPHLSQNNYQGHPTFPTNSYHYQHSPQSVSSTSPSSSQIYFSTNSTPQQVHNKSNPMNAASRVLETLISESRDSDEDIRSVERVRNTASGDVAADETYDSFPTTMPVTMRGEAIPLKVVLIGDKKSGKTSLLNQYYDQKFSSVYTPSDGVDSRSKRSVVHGRDCKVQIWDTCDGLHSRDAVMNYSKGAHCFGIVYDLLNYQSVESIPAWIQFIKERFSEQIPIVLIGNKLDKQSHRAVGRDSIQQYAIDCGLQGYIEVSAKTSENVAPMIDLLGFLALERYLSVSPLPSPTNAAANMPSGLSSASEDALLTKYHKNKAESFDSKNAVGSPLPRKRSALSNGAMEREEPGIDLGDADDDNNSVVSAVEQANSHSSSSSSSSQVNHQWVTKDIRETNSQSPSSGSSSPSPDVKSKLLGHTLSTATTSNTTNTAASSNLSNSASNSGSMAVSKQSNNGLASTEPHSVEKTSCCILS